MNVIVPIPDKFAARFGSEAELGRRVLEALALEEYRTGRMSRPELRQLLGFGTRGELDCFLKDRGIVEDTTAEGLEQDPAGVRHALRNEDENERKAAAAELVERFKAFRVGKTLGGLNIKDLIAEGRR